MAKRKAVRRIDSSAAQEDSWVELRAVKYGEVTKVMEMGFGLPDSTRDYSAEEKTRTLQAEQHIRDIVAESIVNWNWVDDEDQPLPVPQNGAEVGQLLYTHEVSWLTDQVMGTGENQKN